MPPIAVPLPDYYAVLQVHTEAEAEVIRAAYLQLMRKYHPDSVPEEQRQEVLQRVQWINTAYEVLSDPFQRAAYDALRKRQIEKPALLDTPGLETRIHQVRCARTNQTYKMLLARRAGSQDLFRVTGFELAEDAAEPPETTRALMDGKKDEHSLRALLRKVFPDSKKQINPAGPPPQFPTQHELQGMFGSSDSLSFSDIHWAGFNCPACHTDFQFNDGKNATWCHCSACSRIYCAGNLHQMPSGVFSRCPWCGRRARITRHINPGEKADMPVGGEMGRSQGELPKLNGTARLRLPEKRED